MCVCVWVYAQDENALRFMKSVCGLLAAALKVSSPLSERASTIRGTEAASSDTHACIIIISEAFNNPSLSFEDNLWGIIESNHFFCPGFLSDKTLLISPIPIGRVFIFSVFSDIIKDAADFSHPASSSFSSSVVLLSECANGTFFYM